MTAILDSLDLESVGGSPCPIRAMSHRPISTSKVVKLHGMLRPRLRPDRVTFPRRLRYSQATKMPVNHAALRPINQEIRTAAARGPWVFPIETQSMGSCLSSSVSGTREQLGRTKGSKPTRPNSNLWLKLSVCVGA